MNKLEQNIKELEILLDKKISEWPYRKKAHFEYLKKTSELYQNIVNSDYYKKFKIDLDGLNNSCKAINHPIVICGNMKSGTSLLTQLFDGHKDIFTIPGDAHFFNLFVNEKMSFEKMANWWLRKFICPSGQKPAFPYGKDPHTFIKFLKTFEILANNENIYSAVLKSVLYSFSNNKSNKYWLTKTPGNEFRTKKILEIFPNAKFIHIYRNPADNISSLIKLEKVRNKKSSFLRKAMFHRYSLEKGLYNKKEIPNYLLLKYENLISDPQNKIQEICNIFNIDFEKKLLIPTVNSIPTQANSMIPEFRTTGRILNNSKRKKNLSSKQLNCLYKLNKKYIPEIYQKSDFRFKKKNKKGGSFIEPIYYLYKIYRAL